ncbi:MAG: efflux RND transporter periplasmic adaptor subunit [Clostridia bacterium]
MITVLAAVALLSTGCEKLETQVEQLREREKEVVMKVKAVSAFVLEAKKDALMQELIGTVVPRKELSLSFGVSGKIAKIYVQKGSAVKAGDRLASLDTSVWQQEITAAQGQVERAELQRAKTLKGAHATDISQQKLQIERARQNWSKAQEELSRSKLLFQNGAISKEELEQAVLSEKQTAMVVKEEELRYNKLVEAADRLEVEEANAGVKEAAVQLTRARQDMRESELIAPFGGIVAAIQLSESEQAGPGTEVIKLIDSSGWLVQLQVDSDQIGNWSKGKKVKLSTGNGVEMDGIVSFVAPVLDQTTGTYPVEVSIQGEAPELKGGMTVTCRYDVKSGNALLVPVTAVGISDESHYVMKINHDTVEKTDVKVGALYGEYYEVLEGLEVGDQIVSKGLSYVLDGEVVRVANEQ